MTHYIAPKKVREISVDEMLKLRRQGVTLREIGDRLGISRQRVHMLLGNTRDLKPRRIVLTPEEKDAERERRRIEKFWSSIDIGEPDGCWLWGGNTHPITGYGVLTWGGRNQYSHRVAYQLVNGDIPKKAFILHSCDTPACCNPAHLRIGTPQDNVKDRDIRHRHRSAIGSKEFYRNRRKYIAEQCHSIDDIKRVATEFGVGTSCIYNIWRRVIQTREFSQ